MLSDVYGKEWMNALHIVCTYEGGQAVFQNRNSRFRMQHTTKKSRGLGKRRIHCRYVYRSARSACQTSFPGHNFECNDELCLKPYQIVLLSGLFNRVFKSSRA